MSALLLKKLQRIPIYLTFDIYKKKWMQPNFYWLVVCDCGFSLSSL